MLDDYFTLNEERNLQSCFQYIIAEEDSKKVTPVKKQSRLELLQSRPANSGEATEKKSDQTRVSKPIKFKGKKAGHDKYSNSAINRKSESMFREDSNPKEESKEP